MPVEMDQIRSKIVDTLGKVNRVLDVGCGNCDLCRFLASDVATEALGVDINSEGVHERMSSEGDGEARIVHCRQQDAQRMDCFEDGYFDAAVSVHALHEISDPHAALREIGRVLRDGGILLIADFESGEKRWHETYFTSAQVRDMLTTAGFGNVKARKVRGEHFIFATAVK